MLSLFFPSSPFSYCISVHFPSFSILSLPLLPSLLLHICTFSLTPFFFSSSCLLYSPITYLYIFFSQPPPSPFPPSHLTRKQESPIFVSTGWFMVNYVNLMLINPYFILILSAPIYLPIFISFIFLPFPSPSASLPFLLPIFLFKILSHQPIPLLLWVVPTEIHTKSWNNISMNCRGHQQTSHTFLHSSDPAIWY